MFRKMKNKISVMAVIMFACWLGVTAYLDDYYRAEKTALEAVFHPAAGLSVVREENRIVFSPVKAEAGFIFYPGGKVQCEAYAPLMSLLAKNNIMCVIVEMPANLAVLDPDAADGIIEEFPEISDWYIGGHSLGGAMAASYIEKNAEQYDGLILLAAYSAADISETGLNVLSMYGSNDRILNLEKYQENIKNLPLFFEEVIIEGGSHAYFGAYGLQEGDGEAEITNEEQIQITAEKIEEMIKSTCGRETPGG